MTNEMEDLSIDWVDTVSEVNEFVWKMTKWKEKESQIV